MKILVRLLLATLVVTGFHLGMGASPAVACSCAMADDKQYAELADAVFVADFVKYSPPPRRETMSSTDPAVWTFAVSAVYKGAVAAQQDVVSAMDGASCGLEIPQSGRSLVFARNFPDGMSHTRIGGQVLYSSLCAGTRSLTEGPVPASFGEPKPPLPGVRSADFATPSASPTTSAPETVDPTASASARPATAAGPGRGADWATAATVATGGVALGLAGLLVSRRLLRPKGRV